MKLTRSRLAVALALLDDPQARQWGYELCKRAQIRSGVLYPILNRFLEDGWLEDGWEDAKEITEKRPPRRYYRLTDLGIRELGGLVARAQNDVRFTAQPRWGV
ncbi:helix-turn-helix transcriptional regulator [Microbacteriaceae bacterium VKM Ac-2854]|nr:helix-turn-helix transcriptional regulator [Microbacteriaceae bacterium VKM Ac-2854]